MAVCAELQIDAIGVIDQILCHLLAHERGEISAHFVRQGQLSIRKRAGARKAGGDVAIRPAIDALMGDHLGAAPLLDGLAFFHNGNALVASLTNHLNRRKYAGRACADDDDILIHTLCMRAKVSARPPFTAFSVHSSCCG